MSRSRHEQQREDPEDDCLGSAAPLMDPTGDPVLDAKLSQEQAELTSRYMSIETRTIIVHRSGDHQIVFISLNKTSKKLRRNKLSLYIKEINKNFKNKTIYLSI